MTTTPDAVVETTTEPTVPSLTDLPLGDRVAADLATLGELAKTRQDLADVIATTCSQLYLVLARSASIVVDEVITYATAIGAVELADTANTDEHFPTRHVDLPAGVVRLSVLQLDTTTQFGWFNQ